MKRRLPLLLLGATLALTACGPTTRAPEAPRAARDAAGTATSTPGGTASPTPGGTATSTPGGTAGPGGGVVVEGWSAGPEFAGGIVPGTKDLRPFMRWSWRRGCPVPPERLRMVRADFWGFDRRVHRGELIVHRDHARRILAVMEKLFDAHYPIERMRLVDAYEGDDDRSMAANNTSAFNCRRVSGTRRWSEHAYGLAIDVNPLRNPYVTAGGRVSPPAGRRYANRARAGAAMIRPGDKVVRAFAAAGWKWGGYWSGSRDYQHFSATGR
jgi:D-alanyl-D-alanine carboxypeptidase